MAAELIINWRFFSLEQVNSQQDPQWKIWEQPPDYSSRGLAAFRAAQAARNQGEAAVHAFSIALFKARHEERRDIADTSTLTEVAESVKLDMPRFQKDIESPDSLTGLAEDHTHAVEALGVFGTPTLVFPENQAVFLKMAPPPSAEESLSVFGEVRQVAEQRRNIQEIKRPAPPKR